MGGRTGEPTRGEQEELIHKNTNTTIDINPKPLQDKDNNESCGGGRGATKDWGGGAGAYLT